MLTKRSIRKRLHASTLVEVLVALVIFTLISAVAATLYAKMILKRPDNVRDLQLELKELAQRAKREHDMTSARFEIGRGIQVSKNVSAYRGDTLLLLLEFRAWRTGRDEEVIYREIMIDDE